MRFLQLKNICILHGQFFVMMALIPHNSAKSLIMFLSCSIKPNTCHYFLVHSFANFNAILNPALFSGDPTVPTRLPPG